VNEKSTNIGFAAGLAMALLLAASTFAMILTGGDEPIDDQGWPVGSVRLANLPARISYWAGPPFGGGMHQFEYHAQNTEQFNQALKVFAEIRAPRLELIVHNGPKKDYSRGINPTGQKKRIDWTFTVWDADAWDRLYNSPRSYRSHSDHPNFNKPVDPPKIDLYVGGGAVIWEKVKAPENIKVIDKRPGSISPEFAGKGLVRGRVFDMATQKPILGAQIVLLRRNEKMNYQEVKQAKTDKKGFCQIAQIPTGYYKINVLADGYVARTQGSWNNDLPEFLKFKVELAKPKCVKGIVVDTAGQPIEGVKVSATEILSDDGFGYPCAGERSATSDKQGKFEICDLPSGTMSIRRRSKSLYLKYSISEKYDIPSDNIKLVMVGTGTIIGKVVGKDGKRPEGGISVKLEPEGGSKPGTRGFSGRLRLNDEGTFEIKGIPPGKYIISTRPNPGSGNFEPNIGKIKVEGGKTYEIEVLHEDVKDKKMNIIRKFLERRLKDEQ